MYMYEVQENSDSEDTDEDDDQEPELPSEPQVDAAADALVPQLSGQSAMVQLSGKQASDILVGIEDIFPTWIPHDGQFQDVVICCTMLHVCVYAIVWCIALQVWA